MAISIPKRLQRWTTGQRVNCNALSSNPHKGKSAIFLVKTVKRSKNVTYKFPNAYLLLLSSWGDKLVE